MDNLIKILAMDGGNGLNTADLLQRLEKANNNSFLNQTDIFAGTSAGGINSLFFAFNQNPTTALTDLTTFWNNVNRSVLEGIEANDVVHKALAGLNVNPVNPFSTDQWRDLGGTIFRTMLGLGEAAVGCRSLFLNDVLQSFLIQYFGADTTLGSLRGYVVVLSFEMDNGKPGMDRSWAPRLFTNLPYAQQGAAGVMKAVPNPDVNEKIVDVAVRTSAAPLEFPIYQGMAGTGSGYVDGGLVANNPSMLALAAIVGTLAHQRNEPPTQSLSEIYMLSVGTGRNLVGTAQYLDPTFKDGSAPWGYRQWLFDPTNPLVLADAFLQGGNEAAAWACGILMGADHFHRLNVPLQHMLVPGDPATAAAVAEAAVWLNASGWFNQRPETLLPTLVPVPRP